MPQTVKAKLLLGWMPKEEALAILDRSIFSPALSHDEKVALWERYRERCRALPPEPLLTQLAKLSILEKSNVTSFMNKLKKMPIRKLAVRAVKFSNPGQLAIRQFFVVMGRTEKYQAAISTPRQKIHHCLGIGLDERHKIVQSQQGDKTILRLPHFEFDMTPRIGGFDVNEMGRFLSVVTHADRYILWGGYHRSHALLSQMTPDADGLAPLFILMKGPAEAERFFGADSDRPTVRDALAETRPPLLKDFFDPDLFIITDLIKSRMEFHIEPVGSTLAATRHFIEEV